MVVVSLVVHRLGSCGDWAQLPSRMWDLPRQEIKPTPPALEVGFLITRPPDMSQYITLNCLFNLVIALLRYNHISCNLLIRVYNSVVFSIFTELCNHHHNKFQNIFPSPKGNLVSFSSPPLPSSPLNTSSPRQPLIYFLSLQVCFSGHFVYNGII